MRVRVCKRARLAGVVGPDEETHNPLLRFAAL
jgi:hypothetical protein